MYYLQLEKRATDFGVEVIVFCKTIKITPISLPLVGQVVRSASSVGANYREANQAASKKDFRNKIKICQKEASETKHWLQLISSLDDSYKESCSKLWQEAHELLLIFGKIASQSK